MRFYTNQPREVIHAGIRPELPPLLRLAAPHAAVRCRIHIRRVMFKFRRERFSGLIQTSVLKIPYSSVGLEAFDSESGPCVFQRKLILKKIVGVIPPLESKEFFSLRVCFPELVVGGVQTVRQIVTAARSQRCANQFSSHLLHVMVGGCRPALIEKHDKRNHGLIGIPEKSVIVRLNFAHGNVEKIRMMRSNNCSRQPEEGHRAGLRQEVFMQDVRGRAGMVEIPIRRFVQ